MDKLRFCQSFVHLDRSLISFAGRPYLPAIYDSWRNLVLRCSRQTEKSTFLVNTMLYEACVRPGIQMLFVCPRLEQASVFVNSRLLPTIEGSPLIRRYLLGTRGRRPPIMNIQFTNGSTLFVRAAYRTGDSCRGLSASLLLVDEFQDIAEGDLPVLQETMSHAASRRTILTGTPKSVDNHLESAFRRSTANEWTMDCPECGRSATPDEHCLGATGLECRACRAPLDPRSGCWIPRNPTSTWGDGYWICHPIVPWLNYDDILERQRTYDIGKFKNEVLGLSTTAGDHIVTRSELAACCGASPIADDLDAVPPRCRDMLIAGIDWGGGGTSRTVLVIGCLHSDFRFEVFRFERFPASEEPEAVLSAVADRCRRFQVKLIGADGGGNGHVYNRLLLDRLRRHGGFYAILYSAAEHPPRQEGVLTKWTVHRSASIGVVFTRIKKQQILFPKEADCGSYLDEFACETSDYDDCNRAVRYSHPETQPDDALHATNYALLVALRDHHAAQQYAG